MLQFQSHQNLDPCQRHRLQNLEEWFHWQRPYTTIVMTLKLVSTYPNVREILVLTERQICGTQAEREHILMTQNSLVLVNPTARESHPVVASQPLGPRRAEPGPSGVTDEPETDKPETDFQQHSSSSRARTSTDAEPKLPSLKSNRTVTKDLWRSEFKQILERYDKTIEILEEIIRLKQLKYIDLGINIDKPKLKDNQ
ncbi:hypothetical protein ACHWQZ_G015601 [Mnemiopsis leidyi]